MFNLSDSFLVVAKNTRDSSGKTYYKLSLSNGQQCYDFDCVVDIYSAAEIGKNYHFDFDYRRGYKNGSVWSMLSIVKISK